MQGGGMTAPVRIRLQRNGPIPNSRLPVLLYRGILAPSANGKTRSFRKAFEQNGWVGLWTDVIFDYVHFHSNAHEVLGIAKGQVPVELGGEGGRTCRLRAGDMIVLPAGVGHRRLSMDENLVVVGAYPPGQSHYDMKRESHTMPDVAIPDIDPFYGPEGPLAHAWKHQSFGHQGKDKH
jgi:uncharacterized protein YjlB